MFRIKGEDQLEEWRNTDVPDGDFATFAVRVCSDFPPGRGARFFRQHEHIRSGLAAKRRLFT